MFLPGEVLADSDTQVLAAVYYIQCMTMNMEVVFKICFLLVLILMLCICEGEISFARFLPISPALINLPGGGLGLDLT